MTKEPSGKRSKKRSSSGTDEKDRTMAKLRDSLDRMFGYLHTAGLVSQSKQLAEEIFEKYMEGRRRTGRRTAHLFYDSRAIPLAAGMRPSLMSERRLKYVAHGHTIEVSVVPLFPGRFEVTGRVGDGAAVRPAAISLKGRRHFHTDIDEFGFFSFSGVNPGAYSLEFDLEGERVVIDDLELR